MDRSKSYLKLHSTDTARQIVSERSASAHAHDGLRYLRDRGLRPPADRIYGSRALCESGLNYHRWKYHPRHAIRDRYARFGDTCARDEPLGRLVTAGEGENVSLGREYLGTVNTRRARRGAGPPWSFKTRANTLENPNVGSAVRLFRT